MNTFKEYATILKESADLQSEPVGVKFLKEIPNGRFERVKNHRFCQVIMRARQGERLVLSREEISCPAAAAALGFRPRPEKLQDGTMLQGYGIFRDRAVGQKVMAEMPTIEQGKFAAVLAMPLADFTEQPDVVVIEGEVEKLMWISLAYLNEAGGRLQFSTSILQAICVDCAVLPFLSQKINMSFGCYGCRNATDVQPGEANLGIPGTKMAMVVENLLYLRSKAIGRSRSKDVYESFRKRNPSTDLGNAHEEMSF